MLYSLFTLNDSGNVDEIISLDVVSSFKEKYSSNIPENPVEAGFNVSDTINLSNPTFSISGLITDSKFNVGGQLVRYVNGEFVKSGFGESQPEIKLDKPSLVIRNRLIDLYMKKEVFGILEHLDADAPESSSVRYVYPCALADLDFDKSDSSDAIFPSMTIKNIRVTYVEFREVKDPVPDLIPLVKDHLNAGNVTGTTGSTPVVTNSGGGEVSAALKEQKAAADEITKDLGGGNLGGDRGAHLQQEIEGQKVIYQIEAEKAFRERLDNGTLKSTQRDAFVEKYTKIKMDKTYGALGW